MTCPGSAAACRGLVDKSSSFADEGTAAHHMAEQILLGIDGASLVGQRAENGVLMTADMLAEVLKYTNYVQDVVTATGGELFVELSLSISELTGEADAKGTSDAVIVTDTEIIVIDLKYGMGEKVDA
jgi:nicotinamidase-related amidase